jgi:predicted Fe-Mo cluster-binding NifX family protein
MRCRRHAGRPGGAGGKTGKIDKSIQLRVPKSHKGVQRMKVGVAAKGKTLQSHVGDRFGRCAFFIVVDSGSMRFEAIENPGLRERDAAGLQASHMLIQRGVDAVVAKNIGHNALVTLIGAGVQVYSGAAGTVLNAIEKLKNGELIPAERPTVGFQDGLDEVE